MFVSYPNWVKWWANRFMVTLLTLQVMEYINRAVTVLRTQSQLLANHPNANIYNSLSSLVEFDGYYLESEPCLVCNNPEVPFTSVKLSTVKVV